MAVSRIKTLLPLDEYARIMVIPGWHFNQVVHPDRPMRGACDMVWYQSGHSGDPNMITGRDEIAQGVSTAERMIAKVSGFSPAPTWVLAEDHAFPEATRGTRLYLPRIRTRWGYLIAGGLERYDLLEAGVAVTYSDTDQDLVLDTATVTYTGLATLEPCEIVVVAPGRNPAQREWRIRPLDIVQSGTTFTITGPRWWFVDPDEWRTLDQIPLEDDTYFLDTVDIYRHYNHQITRQAQYVWLETPCGDPCDPLCQSACVNIINYRNGWFTATPSNYVAAQGKYVRQNFAQTYNPNLVRIWYYAGYQDHMSGPCDWMGDEMKEAIVRLANIYIPEAPCGCGATLERWEKDREEVEINSVDAAMAQTYFGTTARGAMFAYAVIKRLPPLGRGGR